MAEERPLSRASATSFAFSALISALLSFRPAAMSRRALSFWGRSILRNPLAAFLASTAISLIMPSSDIPLLR